MKTSENLLDDMHQIIFLFLEEAFCEAEAGFCTKIDICLLPDNQVQISDNGRGLPLLDNMDVNEEIFRKTLSGVPLTRLDYENMKEIKNQGLQTAGALCERMDVSVYKNGNVYMQDYVRGIARNNLRCQKMCHKQGMNIRFIPDKEIFGKRRYSKECIDEWVRERLKGVEGVEVKIEDQRIE